MPFIKINYDQEELSRLGLPEQKDGDHKYHYRLFQHSDGRAILIDQIHNHHSEYFETTVLQIEGNKFLVEYIKTRTEHRGKPEYTLRQIILYAGRNIPQPTRKRLKSYLNDIRELFIQQNSAYTKTAWFVRLRIISENKHSINQLRQFTNYSELMNVPQSTRPSTGQIKATNWISSVPSVAWHSLTSKLVNYRSHTSSILRISQIIAGVAFVLLSSRVIRNIQGDFKLIASTIFAIILGYYFVLTNIYILKKSGELLKTLNRKLEPHKAGHPTLLFSALVLGYGYSENHKPIIWLGLGGIFFANYLLTIVRSPFEEMLMEAYKKDQSRKTKDIEVKVSSSTTSKHHYLLTIKNTGRIRLNNIRIFYEPFILDAESFGVDTTHMPDNIATIHDDPIIIESLRENETITFERKGWGAHEDYVGPKRGAMEIGFVANGDIPERKDRKFCLAKMALPNARNE